MAPRFGRGCHCIDTQFCSGPREKKIPRIFSGRRGLPLTVGIIRGGTSEVAGLPVVGKELVVVQEPT